MRAIPIIGMYMCLYFSNYVGRYYPEELWSYLVVLAAFFLFDMSRLKMVKRLIDWVENYV